MIGPLRIFQTTPQLTAFIPLTIPREDMRKVMGPGLAELRAVVAAQNIAVTGPWFTHHVKNPGQTFDFEICLPVAAPVAPTGRVQPGVWPAMTIAQTTYHGGYEGLGAAWGEFLAALKAERREIVEGFWECYVIGPETGADPAAWRTVLSKPLAA
jgi:effector-binding domain-containing protein